MSFRSLTVALIALALWFGRAEADVIFTNLGPGNSFDTSNAWEVGQGSNLFGYNTASGFTSGGSYHLSEIDIALANYSGTNAATVSLWTDFGGAPTKAGILERFGTRPIRHERADYGHHGHHRHHSRRW
jgi:hypothetical protein